MARQDSRERKAAEGALKREGPTQGVDTGLRVYEQEMREKLPQRRDHGRKRRVHDRKREGPWPEEEERSWPLSQELKPGRPKSGNQPRVETREAQGVTPEHKLVCGNLGPSWDSNSELLASLPGLRAWHKDKGQTDRQTARHVDSPCL